MRLLIFFLYSVLFSITLNAQMDIYYQDIGYFEKTEKSLELLQTGNYKGAIAMVNRAIKEGDNPALAYTIKGYIYCNIVDLKKGLKYLHKAIKLSPGYLAPVDMLCGYYSKIGDFDKAMELSTEAIMANPASKTAFLIRATVKLKKSYSDIHSDGGAQVDLDYAYQISEDSSTCSFEIGLIYQRMRDYPFALKYYNMAISQDSTNAIAHLKKGIVLKRTTHILLEKTYCDEFNKAFELGNKRAQLYLDEYCK